MSIFEDRYDDDVCLRVGLVDGVRHVKKKKKKTKKNYSNNKERPGGTRVRWTGIAPTGLSS